MPKEKLINDTRFTEALDKAKRYTDNVTAPMIDETEAKTLIRDSFNDQQIWFKDFVTEEGLEDLRVSEDMTESEVQSKIFWYTPRKKFYAPNPQKGFFTAYAPYSFRRVTSKIFFCQANSKFYRFDPITRDLVEAYPESTTSSQNTQIPLALFHTLPKIILTEGGAMSMDLVKKWSEFTTTNRGMLIINFIHAMKNKDETQYRLAITATNPKTTETQICGVDIPLEITGDKTEDGQYLLREGIPFIEVDLANAIAGGLKDPYGVVSVIRNGEVEKIQLQ